MKPTPLRVTASLLPSALGTVIDLRLFVDVHDGDFDGMAADKKVLANLGIGQAPGRKL